MAKFYEKIGYASTVETAPSVWVEQIVERYYYGDILRNARQLRSDSEQLNDNVHISNKISIVADPYALNHFFEMRYVTWTGANWKITDVEVQRPRLILTIGEVYNGPTA